MKGGEVMMSAEDFADDVFVDFFNTFLNLPVFGQTPLYIQSENRWFLCPEIPVEKEPQSDGFYQWIKSHRLPYFKRTELFHYFSLCKELLQGPPSCQLKGRVQYSVADRWLLKRCLGSVQGMRRFCSFLKGTQGEDLVTFCVRVEQLLHLDWRSNPDQRPRHQAAYAAIKAFHLTEGSSIMAACRLTPAALCEAARSHSENGTREPVLTQMRHNALDSLRSYWLPRFLWACKRGIALTGECAAIAREYEDAASEASPRGAGAAPPPDPSLWRLCPDAAEGGPTVVRTYSSKLRKASLFRSHPRPDSGSRLGPAEKPDGAGLLVWSPLADGREGDHAAARHPPGGGAARATGAPREPGNAGCVAAGDGAPLPSVFKARGPAGKDAPACARAKTPAFRLPSVVTTGRASPPRPASAAGPLARRDHLSMGLSSDAAAGRPFEDFLRARGEAAALRRLGLWQELDSFLKLLLMAEDGACMALRRSLAQRIVTACLLPDQRQDGSHFAENTAANLVERLPSGDVINWIYTAKQELCQILAPAFDRFLEEEDKCFLTHLFKSPTMSGKVSRWSTATPDGPNAPVQQVRRIREAFALSQTFCCYTAVGPLTEETWALLPLEDVRQGGSIHLDYKKYKKALETQAKAPERSPSRHKQLQGASRPPVFSPTPLTDTRDVLRVVPAKTAKKTSSARRPPVRPRHFKDALRNASAREHFASYLQQFHADRDLQFYQAVERLWARHGEQGVQQAAVDKIFIRFFKMGDPAKALQCDSPLVCGLSQASRVRLRALHAAQWLVGRSLEVTWFGKYQNTFPERRSSTRAFERSRAWKALAGLIRNICRFRRGMRSGDTRSCFEAYLSRRWADYSSKSDAGPGTGPRAGDAGSAHLRERLVNKKLVAVNLLVNDLFFYLETENFRMLARSADTKASACPLEESDYNLLHQKAGVIVDSVFCAEMAAQLRINISSDMWQSIRRLFTVGRVDRSLFSEALLTVFPTLLFCWKKFCQYTLRRQALGADLNDEEEERASLPDYLQPFSDLPNGDWYRNVQCTWSAEVTDTTILRFSLLNGLVLVLPKIKENAAVNPHDSTRPTREMAAKESATRQRHSTITPLAGKQGEKSQKRKRPN